MSGGAQEQGALNLKGATIGVLIMERDQHAKAVEAINAELVRRAEELESAIGKKKRERKPRADKGATRAAKAAQ